MAAIYLVRHGQASFGGDDYDHLSSLGHEQAQVLGRAFAARGLAPVRALAGTMRRHQQTAAGCLAELPAAQAVQIDDGWNEYDHLDILARLDPRLGTQAGLAAYTRERAPTDASFASLFRTAMARWMSGEHDADYRESWPTFVARVHGALDRLAGAVAPGEQAVVFTSGGPISVVTRRLMGLDLPQMLKLNTRIANASVTKLVIGHDGPALATLNEHGHFEHAAETYLTYR